MIIRQARKEEFIEIENLVFEAFQSTSFSDGTIEKSLVKEIREKQYYIPELDIVAEDNGKIVGHFMLTSFPISQQFENDVLLLSPVSVAVSKHRQGIGQQMIKEGLRKATDLGFKGVVVEGDYRYYRKFGFDTSTKFGITASPKNLPPSEEYLMALELQADGLKDIEGEVDFSIYTALQH